jgi:WD40 repeat protein
VATASDDHTVRLWDVSDLRQPQFLAALTGHTNRVWSVGFSPDGHTAATAGDDGTTLLRETDIDAAARRICQTTPAISAADWHQFFPERAYQPPCP